MLYCFVEMYNVTVITDVLIIKRIQTQNYGYLRGKISVS